MATISERGRDWLVLGGIDLGIGAVILWQLHTGVIGYLPDLWLCWIFYAAANVWFLLFMRWRNRRLGHALPRRFVLQAAAVALGCGLLTTALMRQVKAVNRYDALAYSKTPLRAIHPLRDRLIVQLIRERAADSRQYQAALAKLGTLSPPVYSPASFESEASISTTLRFMQRASAVESAYDNELQQSSQAFRSRMVKADPAYLRSWNRKERGEEAVEDRTITLERQWIQSVVSLYHYAAAHENQMEVLKSGVLFSAPDVKTAFEQKELSSVKLEQQVSAAQQAWLKYQKKAAAAG